MQRASLLLAACPFCALARMPAGIFPPLDSVCAMPLRNHRWYTRLGGGAKRTRARSALRDAVSSDKDTRRNPTCRIRPRAYARAMSSVDVGRVGVCPARRLPCLIGWAVFLRRSHETTLQPLRSTRRRGHCRAGSGRLQQIWRTEREPARPDEAGGRAACSQCPLSLLRDRRGVCGGRGRAGPFCRGRCADTGRPRGRSAGGSMEI